jgi:Holliday junction DNA helicase RuvA
MIDQLKGSVGQKTDAYAVIFVNGIGYKVMMSINGLKSLPNDDTDVHILTYLHIREDIMDLYGFSDSKERETFHLLLSITGIGPKLALTILSGIDPIKLKDSVVDGNLSSLTSVPGVGTKTAKRIIIELKEKFIKIDSDSLGFEDKDVYHSSLFNDTVNALTGLGYKPHHAKKACSELEEKGELQGPIEDIIKKALNQLMS